MCYVTMVPFCELFNHECTDVYYDYLYRPDNIHKKEESEHLEPVELQPEEEENATSSDGTYNSDDEDSENEFTFPEQYEKEIPTQIPENLYEKKMENAKLKFQEDLIANYELTEQGERTIEEYEAYINEIRDK